MSVKQDRVAPRTVPDLERKYNWGKRFSEIIGLIDDTRKDVEATESGLRSEITNQATSIRRDTEQIVMEATKTVETVEKTLNDRMDGVDEDITTLTSQVEAKMTAEEVTIAIKRELIDGVDSVKTTTGYTFDEKGLTVSKTGSGLHTQITEDGMKVISDTGKDLLTANSKGVDAVDLKASTYLIVGGRSRFENYSPNRTGCFWVGG
jgi:prophage DNA circulation protein